MKKAAICIGLLFALTLAGSAWAAVEADQGTNTAEEVKSTAEQAEPSSGATSAKKPACRAVLQQTPLMPTDAAAGQAFLAPEYSGMFLPKICPVDCSPCSSPADCIIGGCKAIQCP